MARFASAVAVVFAGVAVAAPPDPATLFPPTALAYAEVRQPAKTADALAELLKGTPLADTLKFSHDRRDALGSADQFRGFREVQALGLFTAPEMLAELKRAHGVSAALLGFDPKSGRPRYAVAVQLGEANALALMVRTYLTTGTNVRRVGKVGDVTVYQNRGLSGEQVKEDGDPRPVAETLPPEGADEATYLYVPGLFVVGSGKAAVADVLERFRKGAKESMADTVAKADRDRPGVFAWADPSRLEKEYAAARRKQDEPLISPALFAHLRFLLPGKTLSPVSGHLAFEPDGLAFTMKADAADVDAAPLLALLAGGTADANDLRVCHKAWGGLTVALPAKEKRAKAVLRLADALAAAAGEVGKPPTERLADLAADGFTAEAELFPTLRSATLVFAPPTPMKEKATPERPDPPKPVPFNPNLPPLPSERPVPKPPPPPKPVPLPTLCLTLDSVAAAKAWEAGVPQLARWVGGLDKPPMPASEVVNGLTVNGLVIDRTGGRAVVYYCRNGDVLAVGTDRGQVLAAASLDPTAKPPAVPPEDTAPAAFAVLRFDVAAAGLSRLLPVQRPADEPLRDERLDTRPGSVLPEVFPGSVQLPDPPKDAKEEKPLTPEERLTKALAAVPPVVAWAGVKGGTLTAGVRFRCEKKPLAELIEAWMTWAESPSAGDGVEIEDGTANTILPRLKR